MSRTMPATSMKRRNLPAPAGHADPQGQGGRLPSSRLRDGPGMGQQWSSSGGEAQAGCGQAEHPSGAALDEGDPKPSFQTLDALGQRRGGQVQAIGGRP